MERIKRVFLSGLAFYLVFISLSLLINMVMFAQAHDVVEFFRDTDTFLASPYGLAITSVVWGVLIAWSYDLFGQKLNIAKPYLKGLVYGALVFFFFIWQQEVFYYQFIEFEPGILWAALLHMGTAFPLGGMVVAVIQDYLLKRAEVP